MTFQINRTRRVVSTVAVLLVCASALYAQAQSATLTFPANGQTGVDLSQPFQWTTVANVQAYYLYVGTSVGATDLVNTGEILTTSFLSPNLPGNTTLYARVWTKVGGLWFFHDTTFTTAALSRVTYPVNGTSNANLSQAIQWTPVANVQSYYLYVGTTPGAKNVIDTGETQATSYLASGVPSGQTLYARLWTNVAGVWRYTDSTFTAASSAPVKSTLTYPADGTVKANPTLPLQWTTVANAQAYYLYVGTSVGAADIVNTGETLNTSYTATSLPPNTTLHARLWTKVANIWRHNDTMFTAAPVNAAFTYPVHDGVYGQNTPLFQWTAVDNAEAYYLYVGTTVGASNLVNSGELNTTSYQAGNLPEDEVLHARIWTKVGGVWRYGDGVSFTFSNRAYLTYPLGLNSDQGLPAEWSTVTDAQTYYFEVGTTPGAHDVINSTELQRTTYPIAGVPVGTTLYARLWTVVAGTWRYRDSTFSAAPLGPTFVYPTDGATGIDGNQPFQWTPAPNMSGHKLIVGTTPGASDLFDSGWINGTSVPVSGLPSGVTLYARVLSRRNETAVPWHADAAFTVDSAVAPATIVSPADGDEAVDTGLPFEWTPVPLARAYRLRLGYTIGGNQLYDSGEIHVTRQFVPEVLPIGIPIKGRVDTKINGVWQSTDFSFSVTANGTSVAAQIQSALWATGLVRQMARVDNRPFTWTTLAGMVPAARGYWANCTDFAAALLDVLDEMNVQLTARRLDVALNPNGADAHTLVEMFNPDTSSWLLLDPTFGLTVRRTSDNGFATAEQLSVSTAAQQWSDMTYELLTPEADAYAKAYYIDYPMLFVNVYHQGDSPVHGVGGPVLPYMESLSYPLTNVHGVYAIGCSGVTSSHLSVDGVGTIVDCSGVDGVSRVFGANSVTTSSQTAPGTVLYRPRRFVFIP